MECPECGFQIRMMMATADFDPATVLAPLLCEKCHKISLLENGALRRVTPEELAVITTSEAGQHLERARLVLERMRMARNATNN